MSALERISLSRRDLATEFAGDSSSEKAAAHTDAAMNAPTVQGHPCLCQGPLPGKYVRINGVDESSVKIEDQCWHSDPKMVRIPCCDSQRRSGVLLIDRLLEINLFREE